MAKEIVRQECIEPGKRSRLWDYDDIYHVLTKNKGTKKIEAISLNMSSSNARDINLTPWAFAKMKKLRLLEFYVSAGVWHDHVIHVAFGSATTFDQAQFQEFAMSLELCNRPFIWVVRPDFVGSVKKYRANALDNKEKLRNSIKQGGCSSSNFISFVEWLNGSRSSSSSSCWYFEVEFGDGWYFYQSHSRSANKVDDGLAKNGRRAVVADMPG
ncbi:hypothetical protein QYF36_004871 [Acer negundo]|nr:hypothetical protein QYF36_004871 [Acer negundo]